MDLWDLTRLLLRRWYFALPILLVSALVAVLMAGSVEPDYRATGNAVLIPAPGDPSDAEARAQNKPITRPNNPWGDLGFNALGQAAILQVMRQETLAQFRSAGLSESITVQMDIRSPIFIIEAVGTSPAQATATVRAVIKELTDEVAAQQASYGVMAQDTITTRVLTDGSDVETVTSKVKRVLVVIVGLGVLLTMAGTIGIDVLLRWLRSRRRPTGDDGPPGAEEEPETTPNPVIQPRFVATRSAGPNSEATQVIGRIPSTRSAADTQVQLAKSTLPAVGSAAAGRASARGSGRSAMRIENGTRRSEPDENNGSNGSHGRVQPVSGAEATIILPIPRSQWSRGSDDRNGGR
jgi:hypothetical protein